MISDNFKQNQETLYHAALYSIIVFFVLSSSPFLQIPYDSWQHLLLIKSQHDTGQSFLFWPEDIWNSTTWHAIWATIFKLFQINDLLQWAKIIHCVQFFAAIGAVYFFAKTVYSILFHNISNTHIKGIALLSMLMWLVGNGTFSGTFHQSWIMWYSVSYQGIAIPMFWYITALTIKLFYIDLARDDIALIAFQIVIGAILIAIIHPMELLYYLIYLALLCLLHFKRIFADKKLILILFVALLASIAIINLFAERSLPINHLFSDGMTQIGSKIMTMGHDIVDNGLHRYPHSFSDLAQSSILVAIAFLIIIPVKRQKMLSINYSLFIYLMITSFLFFVTPLTYFSAGVAGYLVKPEFVWRLFFASSWFLLIPMLATIVLKTFKFKFILTVNITILILLFFGSGLTTHQTLYGNTLSIINSLQPTKVGFNYSSAEVNSLHEFINQYEKDHPTEKPRMYYLRGDLAYILRGLLGKYVFQRRRYNMPLTEFYEKSLDDRYQLVDLSKHPFIVNFRRNEKIFTHFKLDSY